MKEYTYEYELNETYFGPLSGTSDDIDSFFEYLYYFDIKFQLYGIQLFGEIVVDYQWNIDVTGCVWSVIYRKF
jgi:hypothetical protein